MTVSSELNRKEYAGDGVTTAFATSPVVFFDSADLKVYVVTTATGVATLQTITTHYTVSGGDGSTGTVTMVTAPTAAQTLVILRVLPYTQADDFVNNDINDAEVLEDNLDRIVMRLQQLDEEVGRSLKVPSSEGEQTDIAVAGNAGYYLRRNVAGTAFELSVGDVSTSTFTQSGTGAVERSVTAKLGEFVSVKDFGATGDGTTDDTSDIQAAIDAVSAAGGGELWFPSGTYIATGLVLKDNVVLRGAESGYKAATTAVRIKSPSSGGIVIDTPATAITGAGVIGINVYGYGSTVAGKGIRFRDVDFGIIRNCMVQNFADEGILVDSTSIACRFENIRLQNCLLDRTQAAKIGVVDISGTDHYFNDVEATASSSALSDANAYLCAFVVRGDNSMFKGCIGEISDIGFHLASGGARCKFIGCRADLNFAHGWQLAASANYNMFSACHAYRNGLETNNTYSGFITAATAYGNLFSSCFSENAGSDTNKCKYGFEDLATNVLTANRSKFVACDGQNYVTSLFYVEPLTGTSPTLPSAPITMANSDTTPSIAGSCFLRCSAVSVATSVTNFDDGVNGQDLFVLGDVDVTIVNGSGSNTIRTNTLKNKVLRANTIYHFKLFNGVWYEQAADQVTTGTFTCANAALTTVNDVNVTAASIIQIQPTNAAAGALQAGATHLYISARTAGTSFGVTTANAAAAAGTETFNYILIN
jgi:hypothetical protein